MSPIALQITYGLLGTILGLYLWEYSAVRSDLAFSPSVYLQYVADILGRFFESCGHFVAWFSSFLTIFDFADMYKTGLRLVNPILEIIFSGYHFIIGYVSEINLYDYPYVVLAGSIIIITSILFAIYYFRILPSVNEYVANITITQETTGTNNVGVGPRRSNRMVNQSREASE
jgi:hypothetical protein